MPTTTANGLPATAVRGVPNTWIVREARTLYWAITTDGTPIDQIDTDMTVSDRRWSIPGTVNRTHVRDYDTAEDGRTLAGYERATAAWAREYDWYRRGDAVEAESWRHDFVIQAREVQAGYVAVHPQLAGAPWFGDHGSHTCVFCLMAANEAAGLPVETGMDPVAGGVAKPGLEAAA